MAENTSALTDAVRAMIGVTAEKVEASLWGIEREGLRRFTQAIMDPDPRYWDDAFARTTRYGGIVAPPIYCTYLTSRMAPGEDDDVTRAFRDNPNSDGTGDIRLFRRGALPKIPTDLKRRLNAGNEIELLKYPTLGDMIYSQAKYANIVERVGKDGTRMLIVTSEIAYTDQNGVKLCVIRQSSIIR